MSKFNEVETTLASFDLADERLGALQEFGKVRLSQLGFLSQLTQEGYEDGLLLAVESLAHAGRFDIPVADIPKEDISAAASSRRQSDASMRQQQTLSTGLGARRGQTTRKAPADDFFSRRPQAKTDAGSQA